ncbi:hypothetical protein [Caballeronia sordidicola]|uniref:Uncharacterized protein n=1 Tax=Caballeronia sordidicola TaxID=196367 RepID=A0A226WUK8_CABSO|nr:hypothetical protein [Caballeronia sordidicola]OXC74490.1 hypothetical protein BSU04_31755 [Caballeronia sordidicola]
MSAEYLYAPADNWVLQPALATEALKIPMTASRWQIKGDVAFEQDNAKQDILVIKKAKCS